jgi:hypothetical protein
MKCVSLFESEVCDETQFALHPGSDQVSVQVSSGMEIEHEQKRKPAPGSSCSSHSKTMNTITILCQSLGVTKLDNQLKSSYGIY